MSIEAEPVAWRETHGKVIKALASIVNVHTPNKLFDLDAIPRDPVMALVQDIKVALDKYKPPQPKREPLTDEQVDDLHGEANRGFCIEREDYFKAFRDAETAHGITSDMKQEHVDKTAKQRHEWVGLTAEEREQVQSESYGKVPHYVALIAAVESKLKQKNQ